MRVYAGIDPLTGREIRLRRTCKTERAAQIELGKLLEQAVAGRQPDSAVTVAQLLDRYVSTAGWGVSTRVSNLGYIRRTIKPAIGSTQVRKVRGAIGVILVILSVLSLATLQGSCLAEAATLLTLPI